MLFLFFYHFSFIIYFYDDENNGIIIVYIKNLFENYVVYRKNFKTRHVENVERNTKIERIKEKSFKLTNNLR